VATNIVYTKCKCFLSCNSSKYRSLDFIHHTMIVIVCNLRGDFRYRSIE